MVRNSDNSDNPHPQPPYQASAWSYGYEQIDIGMKNHQQRTVAKTITGTIVLTRHESMRPKPKKAVRF